MTDAFIHKRWAGIINRAEKRGHFTGYDHDQAMNWNCCAVGERDQACDKMIGEDHIKQDFEAEKFLTNRAYTLGTRFYNSAVLNDKFKMARRIMIQIGKMKKESFYR